jgi:hypothetical protein
VEVDGVVDDCGDCGFGLGSFFKSALDGSAALGGGSHVEAMLKEQEERNNVGGEDQANNAKNNISKRSYFTNLIDAPTGVRLPSRRRRLAGDLCVRVDILAEFSRARRDLPQKPVRYGWLNYNLKTVVSATSFCTKAKSFL